MAHTPIGGRLLRKKRLRKKRDKFLHPRMKFFILSVGNISKNMNILAMHCSITTQIMNQCILEINEAEWRKLTIS